jgi:hypothetical protein
MNVDPQYLKVGMEVVGDDGELAGTIKEVRTDSFHLDRPMARDVLVPLDAIQAIVDASGTAAGNPRVILTIRADSIGDTDWPHPD